MKRYNPLKATNPEEWLDTDELERLRLVEDYHRRLLHRVPNVAAHAIFHVIVENQVALGDEIPVGRTLDRLMRGGLDRHDAIHAVGSVLAEHIFELSRSVVPKQSDPNAPYYRALETLTVESWRQTHG